MRMIQVGAGVWGSSWAATVAASPHWELGALVDPDEAALARVADAVGIPIEQRFHSFGDAVSAVEADAVLIVAPPPLHGTLALEALDTGHHCLVEKPLAMSISEARQLVKRADHSGRTLMASQNFRFDRGYRTVRRLIQDDAIGEIGRIQVDFRRTPVFVGFRLEMDEPLLVDMAVHHLDQLRGLSPAQPVRLSASSFNPSWSSFRGNAVATIEVELDGGAIFDYAGSWVGRGPETSWNGDWIVEGERGAIVWRDAAVEMFPTGPQPGGRFARLRRRRPRVRLEELQAEGRGGVLAELAAAIREKREPETSGRDNLGTLELVFAAVESAQTGKQVSLKPF